MVWRFKKYREGKFEIKNKNDLINFKQIFSYKNFKLKKF